MASSRTPLLPVLHVQEVDGHLKDVGEGGAGGVEHGLHVQEHLPRLRRDVRAAHDVALGIGGRNAGNEKQVVEAHRVAVVADGGREALHPVFPALGHGYFLPWRACRRSGQ
jgi:hypothetical protein